MLRENILLKMKSGFCPNYLSNLIPEHTNQSYNSRHIPDVPPIQSNSQSHSSFLTSTIRLWNAFADSSRNAVSVASFKHSLNKNKKSNSLHNLGSRRNQTLYARLHLVGSSLHHDFYRKILLIHPCVFVALLKLLLVSFYSAKNCLIHIYPNYQ